MYGQNSGAAWINDHLHTSGVRSTVDLESVNLSAGRTVVHPSQVTVNAGDFVGWGTYNGAGTDVEDAEHNCPDDYTGWNLYMDGTDDGQYFCYALGVELSLTAQNQAFKVSFGTCDDGYDAFRGYLNSNIKLCHAINGEEGTSAVGGEAVAPNGTILLVDVHYGSIDKMNHVGDWTAWAGANASGCAETGYRIRQVGGAADDVWAEKTP